MHNILSGKQNKQFVFLQYVMTNKQSKNNKKIGNLSVSLFKIYNWSYDNRY